MIGRPSPRRRSAPPILVTALAALLMVVLGATIAPALPASATASLPPTVSDPAALVHPLDGTGTGPVSPGTVGEFPGADTPFGMIQWSPDTTPNAVQSGGGYDDADSQINGFSLTHLSGTGCPSYQDVPMLPTVGPIDTPPLSTHATFSHAGEQATPGRYHVTVQSPAPIGVTLAVTKRSGIASFSFPAHAQANILFKVGDSINPVSAASATLVGHDEIEGQVTSGQFCQTGTAYTLHFVALFDHPFSSAGTFDATGTNPGATTCSAPTCGAYASFATSPGIRTVLMKVGISFVSTADAAQNLNEEDPRWSVQHVAAAAHTEWNALLGRVAIGGGTSAEQHTFYTALYHSLLFPNVVSDVNGDYPGNDGRVHTDHGREEYANFSEWDTYRSEIQLESLLAPHDVGDMVQSLVDDAEQGGWLPKWAIVGGDESQMNGDSADPIIADAYAMGVRNFDVQAALNYMVKGATQAETNHGLEIERQYLSQYLSQHYVNAASLDLTSIDYSIGGSATLEYAIDDFAISRLADAVHDTTLAATMRGRAANWEYLLNPATGYVQARGPDGSFPPGQAFEAAQLEPGGQTGFEEGNAVQYTWSIPQDLAGLAALMGGDQAAVAKLTTYFTQLNATRNAPYDWSGNEPSEWAPWEFDYFGAPAQTQGIVRAIVDTEYADAPADEPGNDDLGALSSWYVWAALGLFPVTPGTADLALASPLFPNVSILLPDGHRLVLHAPGAAASRPYIHGVTATGVTQPQAATTACATTSSSPPAANGWDQPWLPASVLQSGGALDFTLSSTPDGSWGAAPDAAPPSYGAGQLPAVGFSLPSGGVSVAPGQSTPVQLGVASANIGTTTVSWQAVSAPGGPQISPSSGTLTLRPQGTASNSSCGAPKPASQPLTITAGADGTYPVRFNLRTALGLSLPPVVLDVAVQP
ncbi:MAG TPA: GH92 family glycosyl hydrolase [Acidimicrobiales bacterium]